VGVLVGELFDLTMPFSEKTIPVPGHPCPRFEPLTTLEDDGVRNTAMTISIHTGTHIDAPSHFIADGAAIDEIPIDRFRRPGVRLDLRTLAEPGEPITLGHLKQAGFDPSESRGAILMLASGWSDRTWQSERLYRLVRELQPKIILNDRLDLDEGWDIKTPEQFQPRKWVRIDGQPVVWEACQTFSGSWGYHRDEASWKSIEQLVQMLIDTVSKGGNLLLNVGPTARGEFDERALSRLAGIGEWMKRHGRSIYGCTQAPDDFAPPQDCRLTYNPQARRLYVHMFAWPFKHLHLENMAGRVEYAQLLNDASEVKILERIPEAEYGSMKAAAEPSLLTLQLPVQKPNVTVPVI
jgi:hypothetical protein